MLICPICKAYVDDNATFCSSCGAVFVAPENDNSQTTVLTADMMNNFSQPQQQQAPVNNYPPVNNVQPPVNYQVNNATHQAQYNTNYQQPVAPATQLKTNRSFIKTLLLSMITFGIYAIVTYGHITDDVNLVCSRYDGKKTMNYYLLIFIVTPVTLGIGSVVWMHRICERIGNELKRRQLSYSFGAKDFWLWSVLGSFILVGPFIFIHKFFKSVNIMNEHYNSFG